MACGNNNVSRAGLQSPPTVLMHPAPPVPVHSRPQITSAERIERERSARQVIQAAENAVTAAHSRSDAADAVRSAENALQKARRIPGVDRSTLRALETAVEKIKREARSKISQTVAANDRLSRRILGLPAKSRPAQPPARDVIDKVLTARATPVDIPAMLSEARANERIDRRTREELPEAMAKVQRVSSHAPGLATQVVDGLTLGRSSPKGSGGTVWVSTVRSHGHPDGYAYEILATARFIDQGRTPGNGGHPLRIVAGEDELIFGVKLPAAPGRRTVEADTLIVKPDGRHIGIDAKAYSRPFGGGEELRRQLDGVKQALREGEIHEFHFASRGPLTPTARRLIEEADRELRDELSARTLPANPTISDLQAQTLNPSRPLICYHENLG